MVEFNLGILFFDVIPCAMVFEFKESNFSVDFQRNGLSEVNLVFSHSILRIIIHGAVARKSHVKFVMFDCSVSKNVVSLPTCCTEMARAHPCWTSYLSRPCQTFLFEPVCTPGCRMSS